MSLKKVSRKEPNMTLIESLTSFRNKASDNPRVHRITTGWSQRLSVHARDTECRYYIDIKEGQLSHVQPDQSDYDAQHLLIRGDESLLAKMFSGVVHPIAAYNNGELEVYGDQRDQVKLDAISLVIWGA